jgi:hypothetical protein
LEFGTTDSIRANRKPRGISDVAIGEELSLDELIEALAEAGKEPKRARDEDLDPKIFQAVLHDKARAS